jgi:hypothetical protein
MAACAEELAQLDVTPDSRSRALRKILVERGDAPVHTRLVLNLASSPGGMCAPTINNPKLGFVHHLIMSA